MKRWNVGPGDGDAVDAIVSRAGGDDLALDEGRVFVGKKRAHRGDGVVVGDIVTIHDAQSTHTSVTLIHQSDSMVAVIKPAGMSTIPDQHSEEGTLLHRTARDLGVDPTSLHPTSRLDREVSGVVVFARGARAREAVQAARAKGTYDRRYVALASKAPSPSAGEWSAPIGRAKDPKKRAAHGRDAAPALTRYHVAATTSLACLLSVEPVTGRTHQIRVHASHAGSPLLGDRDYGGPRRLVLPSGKVLALDRIALHCAEVHVLGLDLRAPVPDELRAWWRALGGNDDAW